MNTDELALNIWKDEETGKIRFALYSTNENGIDASRHFEFRPSNEQLDRARPIVGDDADWWAWNTAPQFHEIMFGY